MNLRRLIFPALAIALVIAAISVGWRSSIDRKCQTELERIARDRAALDKEQRATLARITDAEQKRSLGERNQASLHRARAAKTRAQELALLLAKNPALSELHLKSYLADINLRYAPLFRELGWPQERIDQLEALMANAETTQIELQASAYGQNAATDDPRLATLLGQQKAQLKTAEAELLAPGDYQQLEQFEAAQSVAAPLIDGIAVEAALSGTPLTDAQRVKLMEAGAQATGGAAVNDPRDSDKVNWSQLLTQSQGFLSAPQLVVVKSAQTEFETGAAAMALAKQFYLNPPAAK